MLLEILVAVGLLAQAKVSDELGRLLERAKTATPARRILAIKQLREHVDRRDRGTSGFSDVPPKEKTPRAPVPQAVHDAIAATLGVILEDPDPKIREAAAKAMCSLHQPTEPAKTAFLQGLRQRDSTVLWYLAQAPSSVRPDARDAVELLIPFLDEEGTTGISAATGLLKFYGKAAAAAVPALVEASLRKRTKEDFVRSWALNTLSEIGIGLEEAAKLAEAEWGKDPYLAGSAFRAVLTHPQAAMRLLDRHDPLLVRFELDPLPLLRLIERPTPESKPLREKLLEREDLPTVVLAWTTDRRYLKRLNKMLEGADEHSATFLKACARACGAKAERVVLLSEKEPASWKPRSAWPGTDDRRRSPDGRGHGDGVTKVLITGRLILEDGSPATDPRFVNLNDRMLLGKRRESGGPLRYEPQTGRFVFYTTVFAAFSTGDKKKRAPGPYQTGSAQVRIEAKGAKPLTVQFYDEMPDVKVTLRRQE